MANQLSNRICKIEQKLSVEEEDLLDEESLVSLLEWFASTESRRVTAKSKKAFLSDCRKRGIHNAKECVKWLRKEVNGKSLGLPKPSPGSGVVRVGSGSWAMPIEEALEKGYTVDIYGEKIEIEKG